MTAREVLVSALTLMDEIDLMGEIELTGETGNDDTIPTIDAAEYARKAPKLIDILQRDLALCEGVTVTAPVTSLDINLVITDDTAMRIMPYGLAAKFALSDMNSDLYNDFQMKYERAKRTIRQDESGFSDVHGILAGLQIQGCISEDVF